MLVITIENNSGSDGAWSTQSLTNITFSTISAGTRQSFYFPDNHGFRIREGASIGTRLRTTLDTDNFVLVSGTEAQNPHEFDFSTATISEDFYVKIEDGRGWRYETTGTGT